MGRPSGHLIRLRNVEACLRFKENLVPGRGFEAAILFDRLHSRGLEVTLEMPVLFGLRPVAIDEQPR